MAGLLSALLLCLVLMSGRGYMPFASSAAAATDSPPGAAQRPAQQQATAAAAKARQLPSGSTPYSHVVLASSHKVRWLMGATIGATGGAWGWPHRRRCRHLLTITPPAAFPYLNTADWHCATHVLQPSGPPRGRCGGHHQCESCRVGATQPSFPAGLGRARGQGPA